ncbi:hypothetical protein PLICRDRAFT_416458 [Plicaturopsis crispa FD-325 SS-3]|nr:hypothetical protein PLICRDRAFT_416458 [Plicaturopsis crispa FD-325 SS-3]
MGLSSLFHHDSDEHKAHSEITGGDDSHKAQWTHELIAGAASYEAAQAYEKHVAKNGQPQSHDEAKKIIAGISGAFIDRIVETKGLDFVDKEKAKRSAKEKAESRLSDGGQF